MTDQQLVNTIHALKMSDYKKFVENYHPKFREPVLFDRMKLDGIHRSFISEGDRASALMKEFDRWVNTFKNPRQDEIPELAEDYIDVVSFMSFEHFGLNDPFFRLTTGQFAGNNYQALYDHIELLYNALTEYARLISQPGFNPNEKVRVRDTSSPQRNSFLSAVPSISLLFSDVLFNRKNRLVDSKQMFKAIVDSKRQVEKQLNYLVNNQYLINDHINSQRNQLRQNKTFKTIMNRSLGVKGGIKRKINMRLH